MKATILRYGYLDVNSVIITRDMRIVLAKRADGLEVGKWPFQVVEFCCPFLVNV